LDVFNTTGYIPPFIGGGLGRGLIYVNYPLSYSPPFKEKIRYSKYVILKL